VNAFDPWASGKQVSVQLEKLQTAQ